MVEKRPRLSTFHTPSTARSCCALPLGRASPLMSRVPSGDHRTKPTGCGTWVSESSRTAVSFSDHTIAVPSAQPIASSRPPPLCTVGDQLRQLAFTPGVLPLSTTSMYGSPSSWMICTVPLSSATASSSGWSLALVQARWRARLPLVAPIASGEKSEGPGLRGRAREGSDELWQRRETQRAQWWSRRDGGQRTLFPASAPQRLGALRPQVRWGVVRRPTAVIFAR